MSTAELTAVNYELVRPEYLVDGYRLMGPDNIHIISGELGRAGLMDEVYDTITGVARDNSIPTHVSIPQVFSDYLTANGRKERRALRDEWIDGLPEYVAGLACSELFVLPGFSRWTDRARREIIVSAQTNDKIDRIYALWGSESRESRSDRTVDVVTCVNVFGWGFPGRDNPPMPANRDHFRTPPNPRIFV